MKNTITTILAFISALCLLSGCGSSESSSADTTNTTAAETTTTTTTVTTTAEPETTTETTTTTEATTTTTAAPTLEYEIDTVTIKVMWYDDAPGNPPAISTTYTYNSATGASGKSGAQADAESQADAYLACQGWDVSTQGYPYSTSSYGVSVEYHYSDGSVEYG